MSDGCLVLVDDDGSQVLPVFPPGAARWDDDHLVFEGERYAVGDRLELTGGGIDLDDPSGRYKDVDVPDACADLPLVSVTTE